MSTANAPARTRERKKDRYGFKWNTDDWTDIAIELEMFLNQEKYRKENPNIRMMGAAYHFKRIVEHYWGNQPA